MIFNFLNSKVRRLSHIRRYSSLPVIRPENVAEHSFYCALIAYTLAHDLKYRRYQVDPDLAMRKAMLHDLEESMTGDILRSFKYSSARLREEIEEAGFVNMGELALDFGAAASPVLRGWGSSKDGLEGDVVAFADLLCVVAYVREEFIAGNRHLDAVAAEVFGYITENFQQRQEFGTYVDDIYPNNHYSDIFRS